jgi:hypothetical protein
MFNLQAERYMGLDCLRLSNEVVSLLVTTSLGPRILAFQLKDQENLFVELPEATLDCPGKGSLRMLGGHRLWHSPEQARRTYLPDDQALQVEEIDRGVKLTQPVEQETGIQKSLKLLLPDDSATVVVDHTLNNQGMWPVELAPWAITMMKPGGTAILPLTTALADLDGLLPNRHFVFWPYADMSANFLQWGKENLFIHAVMQSGAFKIGYPNPRGWLGYWRALFVKFANYQQNEKYPDQGSSTECYCNQLFLEMETLGPLSQIEPGSSKTHQEVWRVFPYEQFTADDISIREIVEQLNLENGFPFLLEEA